MQWTSVQSSCRHPQKADKQEYVTLVDDRQFLNPRGRNDDRRLAKEAHDHFPFTVLSLPLFSFTSFRCHLLYAVNPSLPRHLFPNAPTNQIAGVVITANPPAFALLNIPGKIRKLVAAPTFHNIFPAGIDEWNCDSFMSNTQKRTSRPIDPPEV